MFKWMKDGISMDEFKVSSLVLCMMIVVCGATYGYIKFGDVSNNWLTLLQTFICTIGAVNGIAIYSNSKVNNQVDMMQEPVSNPIEETNSIDYPNKV
jgi:hypothetical protein